jgi:hypothetical protein
VLKFSRSKNGEKITFIGNLSNEEQVVEINGRAVDALSDEKLIFDGEFKLKPWEYKILID